MWMTHLSLELLKSLQKYLGSYARTSRKAQRDTHDALYVRERIKGKKNGQVHTECIVVDQELKVGKLQEIAVDKTLRNNISCGPDLHQQYRSVMGQIKWLQSRTHFQACYQFSRCASALASSTTGDVRARNRLVRKIRHESVSLYLWPLRTQSLRFVGYPDAAFRNNDDKSS